jgi:hypothetical protein
MNVDRIILLALRIEGAPRPMSSAGRLDPEDEAIAHPSPETPCLTHVLRAQIAAPQGATWIVVLPSERAQSPR